MNADDEVLETLKKILAAQEEGLAISKESRQEAKAQSEETRTRLAEAQSRQAKTARAMQTVMAAKYFQIVAALAVIVLVGYLIFRI